MNREVKGKGKSKTLLLLRLGLVVAFGLLVSLGGQKQGIATPSPAPVPASTDGGDLSMSVGVVLKGALLPLERFGLDGAFIHLRMADFLGIEGLMAILEGGLSSGLRVLSLEVKLLMTRFPLNGSTLTPFTGGGLGLELATLTLIPEGVAGLEYLAPPFLLLGEMRVQSLKGMSILIGMGMEFNFLSN